MKAAANIISDDAAIQSELEHIEERIVSVESDDAGRTVVSSLGAMDLDQEAHFSELRCAGVRLTRKHDRLMVLTTSAGLDVVITSEARIAVAVPKMGLRP